MDIDWENKYLTTIDDRSIVPNGPGTAIGRNSSRILVKFSEFSYEEIPSSTGSAKTRRVNGIPRDMFGPNNREGRPPLSRRSITHH